MPPRRSIGLDGAVSHPTTPGSVSIYEVRGGDLEAAQSSALANPQFGPGGSTQAFIPDVNDAIRDGRLVKVDEHHFDPETTRATFEDPAYRQVDADLPDHAIDPDRERTLGRTEKAREETGRAVGGAAASGLYDRTRPTTSARRPPRPDFQRSAMNTQPGTREVIPGGPQEFNFEHLIPIAKLLIERGHLPIDEDSKFGFSPTQGGMVCALTRKFSEEDWAAINDRFLLPANVVYFHGLIRDNTNWVDMLGWDEVTCLDGVQPVEVWEERERQTGRQF